VALGKHRKLDPQALVLYHSSRERGSCGIMLQHTHVGNSELVVLWCAALKLIAVLEHVLLYEASSQSDV